MSGFHYISVPVTQMRESPSQESQVLSQGLFSEEVRVIDNKNGWTQVETVVDGYQGWVPNLDLCKREREFPSKEFVTVDRLAAHVYGVEDTIYGPVLTLPFESRLEIVRTNENPHSRWITVATPAGRELFIQRGDVTLQSQQLTWTDILPFTERFLGLPYTWGGRSSFGYDCSGFVQMVFRRLGVYLPRNAQQQQDWDRFQPVSLGEVSLGDLVFFGGSRDEIRHVGLCLDHSLFIHTTRRENAPYLRVSRLSDPEWSGCSELPFRSARRLVPTSLGSQVDPVGAPDCSKT